MKMIIIGGPRSGEYYEDKTIKGNPKNRVISIMDKTPSFLETHLPEFQTHHDYVVHSLIANGEEIHFLILHGMKFSEAIEILIESYMLRMGGKLYP